LRQQAVMWLSAVPGERTLSALQDILRTSSDPEIQNRAILALAQFSDPRATATLRDYALRRDVPAEQQAQALYWLGQRGPENQALLREIYAATGELEVKERILFSLAQAGGAANATWLMSVARNTREPIELRRKALHWAASEGIATAELASLYDQLPEDELREQLIYVLARRDEPAAVDKLLRVAREERDAELRKRAIFWLSQSNDPRVAELLLEIIGGR
jgi:HEAT repeat protein